jgi:serine protease AprX
MGSKRGNGRIKSLAVGAIAVLLSGVLPSIAQADPQGRGKISRELEEKVRGSGSDDLLSVIIQTRGEPTSGHFARLHGRGGAIKTRHAAIKGYSARVPASQVAALADDPEVERISHDTPVKAHLDVASKAVRADVAFADSGGLDGQGIGVAVVDTGIQAHRDLLREKGLPPVVEVEVVGHENGLADYFGHGTHVAGIINGNGASSTGAGAFRTFKGLAPGARLISIRALQPDGSGYTSDILAGIDWAIRYRVAHNIRVLNLSLGHPVYESYTTDPLCRAVRAAGNAGILVVVAAGNDGGVGSGFGTITSPANEPSALTVGAMDDSNTVTTGDDVLAWYSSKGPTLIDFVSKPDIVAPGTWLVSLRATGSYLDAAHHDLTLQIGDYMNDPANAAKDGAYYTLSGTSMAAPMVSAAAALMFQKDPSLSPATVKARLMKSAVKDAYLAFETGAGYLDVAAALEASGYARSADSPASVLVSGGDISLYETGLIWGGEMWASSAVWGGGKTRIKSIVENDQVTGTGLIWGGEACVLAATSGTVDNLSAIWGGGKRK